MVNNEGYTVSISHRAQQLYRAENDNRLLKDIPKPMTKRVAILIGCELGAVLCLVLMFVESLVRNS